jgi:hypothetical protein
VREQLTDRTTETFPGVKADLVMITSGRNKGGLVAGAAWFLYQIHGPAIARSEQISLGSLRASLARLLPFRFTPNQQVKTGDLLFEIDPADYQDGFGFCKGFRCQHVTKRPPEAAGSRLPNGLLQRKVSS